ncbi:MAG: hypothetical protein GX321_01390 [Clostridiales bacterium]|nr:hypothetical protein [Clostridiales bacterium]
MNRIDNNKATPTKRTGVKNEALIQNSRQVPGTNKARNTDEGITPEISQPIPNSATPSIPEEMPARKTK